MIAFHAGFLWGNPEGFLHHCGSPSPRGKHAGFLNGRKPLGFLHHCGSPSRFMRFSFRVSCRRTYIIVVFLCVSCGFPLGFL